MSACVKVKKTERRLDDWFVKRTMEKERLDKSNGFKAKGNGNRGEGQQRRELKKSSGSSGNFRSRDAKGSGDSYGRAGGKKDFRKGQGRSGQFYDKDSDYEQKPVHRKPQSSNRDKDKLKEQQPDKMEVVKRLEKEKKAMQKKNQDSSKKRNQQARPQVRIKRTNNIDWTREYENDSFDDDDMYYSFR